MLVASLLAMPGFVSAHELESDNGISAVLHLPPDDKPISGETTKYEFLVSDQKGQLSLTDCDCKVLLKKNGQLIKSQQLQVTDDQRGYGSVIFPKPGVYNLELTGAPRANADFDDFEFENSVRVYQKPSVVPTGFIIAGSVLAGLGVLYGLWLVVNKRISSPKSNR